MTVTSRPFDAISVGDEATLQRVVTEGDLRDFGNLSGDTNPIHFDEAFAQSTPFEGRIVHGALVSAHISTALATALPGPGTIYLEQSVRFRRPVRIGDELTTRLEVEEKLEAKRFVRLKAEVSVGETVVASGSVLVMPPAEARSFELPDRV